MNENTRDDTHRQREQQQQDGVRRGEPGQTQQGHLSPQIDSEVNALEGDQIAQDSEQSSGQGSGQS